MPEGTTEEIIPPREEETFADKVEEIAAKIKGLLVLGVFVVCAFLYYIQQARLTNHDLVIAKGNLVLNQNTLLLIGGLCGGYLLITVITLLIRKPLSMKVSELSIFYRFTKQLEESIELDQIMDLGISVLAQALNAETAHLWLFDTQPQGRRKALFLKRVVGMPNEEVKKKEIQLSSRQGVTGYVAASGKGELIKNVTRDPRFINPLQKKGLRDQISVPLKTKNKVIGAVDLYNKRSREGFHSGDLEMVSVLAAHLAMAIDNANLYTQVRHLADTDRLTELFNYGYFMKRLAQEVQKAAATKSCFSLIIIDVDFFKQFNDRFGHTKGNEVLKKLAGVFNEEVRKGDLAARFGGEEFVLILSGANLSVGEEVAERIRARVERCRFENDRGEMVEKLTISLGVSAYPEISTDLEELIRLADQALYQAKAGGRNRVICAQSS